MVVLHSYRPSSRRVTKGDPAYVEDEVRLNPAPMLSVPTPVLHTGADTCDPLDSSKGREAFFTGRSERQLLDGLGHFPQRETPQLVAESDTANRSLAAQTREILPC
ncbi:hypothetical protein ACM76E_07155 [Pseudomonas aeruginosa]